MEVFSWVDETGCLWERGHGGMECAAGLVVFKEGFGCVLTL